MVHTKLYTIGNYDTTYNRRNRNRTDRIRLFKFIIHRYRYGNFRDVVCCEIFFIHHCASHDRGFQHALNTFTIMVTIIYSMALSLELQTTSGINTEYQSEGI